MFREMVPASKMFQFEWMDQSMEKRNHSFFPDFKWGCNCNQVEVKTYSTGMTGSAPRHSANLGKTSELKSDFLSSPVSNFLFSSLILNAMRFCILIPKYSLLKWVRRVPSCCCCTVPVVLKLKIFYWGLYCSSAWTHSIILDDCLRHKSKIFISGLLEYLSLLLFIFYGSGRRKPICFGLVFGFALCCLSLFVVSFLFAKKPADFPVFF